MFALGGANTLAGIIRRRDTATVRRQLARLAGTVLRRFSAYAAAAVELLKI